MKTYYYANKNVMLAAFTAYFMVNTIASFFLGEYKIFPATNYYRAIGIILLIIGIKVNNEWFHSTFVLIAFILLTIHHFFVYSL